MGWYDAVKDALVVADQLKNVEMKQKLAAVQIECANLAEENARLRQERNELQEKLRLREEMVWDEKMKSYFRTGPSGDREGPFCPKCYGGSDKVIRMAKEHQDFRCPVCRHLLNLDESAGLPMLGFGPPGKSIMDEEF